MGGSYGKAGIIPTPVPGLNHQVGGDASPGSGELGEGQVQTTEAEADPVLPAQDSCFPQGGCWRKPAGQGTEEGDGAGGAGGEGTSSHLPPFYPAFGFSGLCSDHHDQRRHDDLVYCLCPLPPRIPAPRESPRLPCSVLRLQGLPQCLTQREFSTRQRNKSNYLSLGTYYSRHSPSDPGQLKSSVGFLSLPLNRVSQGLGRAAGHEGSLKQL